MSTAPVRTSLVNLQRPLAATWALFLGLGLVMVGNGLQGALVGLRTTQEGFGTGVGGVIMAAYFAGFLVGSRFAARAISDVGHIRVFAALASIASIAALVHALAVTPWSWTAMRFVTGLCMAGLYVVVESWLNDLASNQTRGRYLAAYMVVSMGGLGVGNTLLGTADPSGFELFAVASVLVSAALVPVTLSAASSPPPIPAYAPMPVRALLRRAPVGVVVAVFVGMSHGVLLGLGAVYAGTVGLDPGQVALFVSIPILGSVVLQWPIGLASDRFSRRAVILVVALTAAGSAAMLLVVDQTGSGWLTLAGMFVLGGCSFPLYSLTIAYTNDWLTHEHRVGASTTLVTVNGIGAVVGPLVAGALMDSAGPELFFVALIATHGTIATYLAYRILFRRPPPIDPEESWEPLPPRGSPLVGDLPGRAGDPDPGGPDSRAVLS